MAERVCGPTRRFDRLARASRDARSAPRRGEAAPGAAESIPPDEPGKAPLAGLFYLAERAGFEPAIGY